MPATRFEIIVNGAQHTVEARQLSATQIRALFALDPSLDLVVEGKGASPDRVLADKDVISADTEPVRIYSRPPTQFGGDL